MELKNYKVRKKFISGFLNGLELDDVIVRCSKIPFQIGQMVKTVTSSSYIVVSIQELRG